MKLGAAILFAAALAGCSTVNNTIGDPFVAPGKFQFLRCEEIGKQLVVSQTREQELLALMDRANSGVTGSTVSMFVYEPDLQGVQADLRALRQAAGVRRCSDEVLKAAPKPDLGPVH